MDVLPILIVIIIVNNFILWLLLKLGKLSKEDTLYKRLEMLLVNVPLISAYIYILYLYTDTFKDLTMTLFLSSLAGLIIYIFSEKIKDDEYISTIRITLVMTIVFLLSSIAIIFTSTYSIVLFSIVILSDFTKSIFKSKKASQGTKVISMALIAIFFVVGIYYNYSLIKTKPERVADRYMIEKGYNLDNISYKNIEQMMIRKEHTNMSYTINNAEDNRQIDKIISMTYYKGKIIEYNTAEH